MKRRVNGLLFICVVNMYVHVLYVVHMYMYRKDFISS